jgi:predicted dehydrogenase
MTVEALLIGAGNRGRDTFGAWARANPARLRIVAVAEPASDRRESFTRDHSIPAARSFEDWHDALEASDLPPAVIVATGDTLHVEPALAALGRGCDVLLEKPIAPTPADCVRVVEAAEASGRILQIGHVLRYSAFYERVNEITRSGVLGEVVTLDMKEHVAYWHMIHSFVRGKFRNRDVAAPLLVAKTCHDLDLMVWIMGASPSRVASFGSLQHFGERGAPEGVPLRCSDGCPVQDSCPHDAVGFYLGANDELARSWPWSDVSLDPARAARRRALEAGPYGRCVYRCDNDVVDHQVLAVEFEGGATATFTVHGLASEEKRTIRITGTRGELRGVLHDGCIQVSRHGVLGVESHQVEGSPLGHFGGDAGLIAHFVEVVSGGGAEPVRTSGRVSLDSHLLGFAAEQARKRGEVVELAAFRARVEASARG